MSVLSEPFDINAPHQYFTSFDFNTPAEHSDSDEASTTTHPVPLPQGGDLKKMLDVLLLLEIDIVDEDPTKRHKVFDLFPFYPSRLLIKEKRERMRRRIKREQLRCSVDDMTVAVDNRKAQREWLQSQRPLARTP